MRFFNKKLFTNPLFWLAVAVLGLISLQLKTVPRPSLEQGAPKSPAVQTAQTAKVELPKQATTEAAEWQWSKWVKRQRCAVYKKKVYSSDIDPQLKDLLWGAAVVASEYCWEVDAPPPSPAKPTGKPSKSKAQGLQ